MTPASAALAAILLLAQAGDAGSSSGPTPAHLEVRAGSGCTSRDALVARVEARSPRIRFVESENALAIRVDFSAGSSGSVVGELILSGPGGKPSSRRILARSCAEAVDAVALIIAVTLDPVSAKAPSGPAMRSDGASAATTGEGATDATAKNTAPAAANGSQPPPQARPEARPPKETPPVTEPPATVEMVTPSASTWHLGFSLAGGAIWGPAPSLMPDVAAYALLDFGGESPWSPLLAMGVVHAWRNNLAEPGGNASFALDAASLDGCVLRLRWSSLEARACGSALVGFVTSSGEGAPQPATAHRPFAVLGATGLFAIGLGARFQLLARLGAGWTLVRDSYEFGNTVFHRASRLTTTASLGIGVRFR